MHLQSELVVSTYLKIEWLIASYLYKYDARLKSKIVTMNNGAYKFTEGTPISGLFLEDKGTIYHDIVEMWYYEKSNQYWISIVNLTDGSLSTNTRALIWYI